MHWGHKAADKGDYGGMGVLGQLYQKGLGTQEDCVEACKWYSVALTLAPTDYCVGISQKFKDELTATMSPNEIAEAERLASEWRAAFEKQASVARQTVATSAAVRERQSWWHRLWS